MRKTHIVGNWKMNQSTEEIKSFFNELANESLTSEAWIAPQALHLGLVKELATDKFKVGTQNSAYEDNGAFTGEISPKSIKDMGLHFTIIGHSERRSIFGETHEVLNKKAKKALDNDLTVIFCIGETLEEREAGKVEEVLSEQISKGLKDVASDKVILAYEPVWAIGTGVTASPEQAQDTHAFIRKFLAKETNLNADKTVILYGGSVKPSNVKELLACEDIDGGLVGGASLKAETYKGLFI
ncbi:MAG: triose-phosphate isomerase [Bacteriovorax sp. MedPE-SWde]|nr:MAG: triose-phosphate isomerase [Bacteriovorax sp. MedPE-SWde]